MTVDESSIRVKSCYECDISSLKRNFVNGFGSTSPNGLMFIGEAPGAKEDNYGIPFIGRAGELFNAYLADVGLNRDMVYTTTVIKCRPNNNRAPFPHEIENCLPLLKNEVKKLNPKIVVLLGGIATSTYFQNPELLAVEIRNKPMMIKDRIVLSIYHPAFILRNGKNNMVREAYHLQFRNIAKLYKILVDPLFILKY